MTLSVDFVLFLSALSSINLGLSIGLLMTILSGCNKSVHYAHSSEHRVPEKPVNIKSYPFLASIIVKRHAGFRKDILQCGGSIITKYFVLTTAHCIYLLEEQNVYLKDVVVGVGNSSWRFCKKYDIEEWIAHNKFDIVTMENDISLIKVKKTLRGPYVKSIPITSKDYKSFLGETVKVIGWGHGVHRENSLQKKLQRLDVIVFDDFYCRKLYKRYKFDIWKESMFCAGSKRSGRNTCQFDSGDPILDKNLLIGVASWGVDCGKHGVYTRISHFQNWIVKTIRQFKNARLPIFKVAS